MNDHAILQEPSLLRSPRQTTVLLPDMFQSFLKYKPRINPYYEAVKADSEDWINRLMASCFVQDLMLRLVAGFALLTVKWRER